MQPQGIQTLMPQQGPQPGQQGQQPGPAQPPVNPERLSAATSLVSNDAEKQVLDPRTLAIIKYKDAVAAMQAADQLMQSAQPTPTPPTVAERTEKAAQEGIMGMASRLSSGIQKQGGQMQAEQSQQMMSGGLPQLPAPNMAGMAQGGIVGYQRGGAINPAPKPTPIANRPVPMGQPSVEMQASTTDDVARYMYLYRNMTAAMEKSATPQEKAEAQQQLQQMQQTFDPNVVAEAHMKMSGQTGMAQGGIVGFQAGGDVEDSVLTPEEIAAAQEALAAMPASTPQPPPPTREEIAAARETQGVFGLIGGTERAARRATAQEEQQNRASKIQALIDMGLPASAARRIVDGERQQTPEAATNKFNTELDLTRPVSASTPAPAPASTPAPAPARPQPGTLNLSSLGKPVEERVMTEGIASLPPTETAEEYAAKRAARLEELTGAGSAVAERKEAEARRRELAESQYTPEKERSRLLRATLAGLGRGGLGGLSAGYAQEEGRIFGERTAESERSVQEMDKLVAELRAMGLSQFEAENVAMEQFQSREDREQEFGLRERQVEAQEKQAGRPTDFISQINMRVAKIMQDAPGTSLPNAQAMALQQMEPTVGDESQKNMLNAYKLAIDEHAADVINKERLTVDDRFANIYKRFYGGSPAGEVVPEPQGDASNEVIDYKNL